MWREIGEGNCAQAREDAKKVLCWVEVSVGFLDVIIISLERDDVWESLLVDQILGKKRKLEQFLTGESVFTLGTALGPLIAVFRW